MTFTHEDANARLLDLVYGEAAPAERTALEAHVAGCASCQSDLKALGDTRARVRVALDDEAPPARAHARILAAAAEAANGASAAAATAPAAKGNEPPSRAARVDAQPSFWDRLRSKWTFPTLATMGAVAIFVLGAKVLLNPEKNLERGKQGLFPQEEAAPAGKANAPAETEALAKTAEANAPAAAPVAPNAEPAPPAEAHRELSPQAKARIEAVRRYAHPRTSVGNMLGERPPFQSDKLGGAPAGQAIQGLRPDDFGGAKGGVGAGRAAPSAGAVAPAPKEKPAKSQAMDDRLEGAAPGPSGGYATPPPNWKAAKKPAAAAPAPPPPTVTKKKTTNDDPLDGLFEGGGGGAPRSAPAPAAPPAAKPAPSRVPAYEDKPSGADMEEADEAEGSLSRRKSALAPERRPSPAPEAAAAPVARSKSDTPAADTKAEAKKEKDAPAPWEAPAKHADELYAARRWSEASAAYNDLLRRFPTAPLAFAWRSRLTIAQREAAPKAPPAAAKKATAPAAASPASE